MLKANEYNEIFVFHINVSKLTLLVIKLRISQIIPSLFKIYGNKCFVRSKEQKKFYYHVFLSSRTYMMAKVIGT